jgi:transposase, IS5 family
VLLRKGKPTAARRRIQHRRAFRKVVRWRTSCEGRISRAKRDFGLSRIRIDGLAGAARGADPECSTTTSSGSPPSPSDSPNPPKLEIPVESSAAAPADRPPPTSSSSRSSYRSGRRLRPGAGAPDSASICAQSLGARVGTDRASRSSVCRPAFGDGCLASRLVTAARTGEATAATAISVRGNPGSRPCACIR